MTPVVEETEEDDSPQRFPIDPRSLDIATESTDTLEYPTSLKAEKSKDDGGSRAKKIHFAIQDMHQWIAAKEIGMMVVSKYVHLQMLCCCGA